MCVSARHDQANKRRLKFLILDIISADMSLNVMHADQRFLRGKTDRFCRRDADKERPDKPRSVRHRDRRDLLQGHTRPDKRLLDHLIDLLYMLS